MALRLLYGGTFDPIHDGHLSIARAARDTFGTTVHLMPAADPPHRPAPGADARHRARMVELAVAGERGLAVELRELRRATPSYSVDTLRELRAEIGPEAPIALLVGADSFLGLPGWKDWRALFDLAHFVVAERADSPLQTLAPALQEAVATRWSDDPHALAAAPAGRVFRLRHPLHPASASAIRGAIAAGGPWRAWVPPAVAAYIDRHALYAGPG
ncbi:MAG TPA: nicotinate-nucleotide adenylyltransferase [Lysobacter sp.]|nr:nicotinate-nucleotide adenylyltransferase [Lysobacter sp.]